MSFWNPESFPNGFIKPPTAATFSYLLLEDGGYLLLEDGGKLILE